MQIYILKLGHLRRQGSLQKSYIKTSKQTNNPPPEKKPHKPSIRHAKPLLKLLVRVVQVTPIITQIIAVALGRLSKAKISFYC